MSAPHRHSVLLTRVVVNGGAAKLAAEWANLRPISAVYANQDDSEVLAVTTLLDETQVFDEIAQEGTALAPLVTGVAAGDWRRELFGLRDVVKAGEFARSAYLQLRRIEVPLAKLADYHAWREGTIFAHVRERADIESFYAYHSQLTGQPGVLFLSAFSTPPPAYLEGFGIPAYRRIVKEAGERFITGGAASLETSVWQRANRRQS
jgi:hypothetical protein